MIGGYAVNDVDVEETKEAPQKLAPIFAKKVAKPINGPKKAKNPFAASTVEENVPIDARSDVNVLDAITVMRKKEVRYI